MQQFCNNCGAPISAGMSACARCGAPVSSGSGSYDPTIRAGAPPGTGYGQQPYGPPPIDPYGGSQPKPGYGAPPPPPPGFGPPPQSSYGTPPPPPGFGPPPQPGFGAPPGVGYGGPQQPFMAPQPKKSRTWIYIVSGILIVLILLCGGVIFAIRTLGNAATKAINNLATQVSTITVTTGFQQTKTTGTHITTIQTGTGFDQNSGTVQGESATFTTSDTIYVVYTVANPDAGAQVAVKLLNSSGSLLDTGNSAPLSTQTNTYANSLTINQAGVYNVEIDYNGAAEATINFQVT